LLDASKRYHKSPTDGTGGLLSLVVPHQKRTCNAGLRKKFQNDILWP